MAATTRTAADDFESQRQARILRNQERMAALGLSAQKTLFDAAFKVVKTTMQKRPARKSSEKGSAPPSRASRRLSGCAAEQSGMSFEDSVLIERKAGQAAQSTTRADPDNAPLTAAQEATRCNSKSRGSIYDSVAGITCHFCRQKKLCGEAGCKRCANRDPDAACIGKSECSRCGGAHGRFCRACLLVRYGQQLEDVQRQMAEGCWLCPHCYEADNPQEGWICNSSICMTRRGLRPTGIAIFEAQAQGFASVAHLVQHQLLSRRPVSNNAVPTA